MAMLCIPSEWLVAVRGKGISEEAASYGSFILSAVVIRMRQVLIMHE